MTRSQPVPAWARAAVAVGLVLLVAVTICGGTPAPAGLPSGTEAAEAATRAESAKPDDGKAAFHIRDERITESSGLAMSTVHEGIVYTINDSDHPAEVYAVDASSGDVTATLEIGEVDQRDWEALATGPEERVWVGDIGDNTRSQTAVTAYRFREPEELVDAGVTWSRFRLRYEDGPHNAEALLIHPQTGRLYVVTKQLSGAGIYQAPEELSDTGDNTLTRVADAPTYITDGSFTPDGATAVLCGYAKGYVYNPEDWAKTGEVSLPFQGQGESLTVTPEGESVLAGSEGKNRAVHEVSLTDVAADVKGPDAPPKSPDPKPSRTTVKQNADESGGPSWLGGLPWWVPVTILVVAVAAGAAAFPPARPKSGDRRTPRRPAYPGSPRDSASRESQNNDPDRSV